MDERSADEAPSVHDEPRAPRKVAVRVVQRRCMRPQTANDVDVLVHAYLNATAVVERVPARVTHSQANLIHAGAA